MSERGASRSGISSSVLDAIGNTPMLEIEYFGERHGATVAEEPLFDPAMKRMRS